MKYLITKIGYPMLLVIAIPLFLVFMLLNAAFSLMLQKFSFSRARQTPVFYQQISWDID